MINSLRMGHSAIEVKSIKSAVEFYTRHFPFDVIYEYEDWGLLRHRDSGDDLALLAIGGRHHRHLGLRVASNSDVDSAYEYMKTAGTDLKTTPKLHRDQSYSFYFSDPDGNIMEVIYDPSNP